ncbi:hypothetical protein TIFTF001_033085 [Ficus carica]|uniref:Uncharacterized protein n=1 Tax=Ficus carica TaxID=3494 RepID=A0AA88J6P0_FICCA|nr:hypothetical protein TIFTF001_033085 [Ficus carica]
MLAEWREAVIQLEEIGGLSWSWLRIQPEILAGWDCGLEKRSSGVTHAGITRAGITGLRIVSGLVSRRLGSHRLGLAARVTGLGLRTWREQLGPRIWDAADCRYVAGRSWAARRLAIGVAQCWDIWASFLGLCLTDFYM